MNKPAIISATISIVIVFLIARCLGINMPPHTILGGVAGVMIGQILQRWVVPAVKKYWGK